MLHKVLYKACGDISDNQHMRLLTADDGVFDVIINAGVTINGVNAAEFCTLKQDNRCLLHHIYNACSAVKQEPLNINHRNGSVTKHDD